MAQIHTRTHLFGLRSITAYKQRRKRSPKHMHPISSSSCSSSTFIPARWVQSSTPAPSRRQPTSGESPSHPWAGQPALAPAQGLAEDNSDRLSRRCGARTDNSQWVPEGTPSHGVKSNLSVFSPASLEKWPPVSRIVNSHLLAQWLRIPGERGLFICAWAVSVLLCAYIITLLFQVFVCLYVGTFSGLWTTKAIVGILESWFEWLFCLPHLASDQFENW